MSPLLIAAFLAVPIADATGDGKVNSSDNAAILGAWGDTGHDALLMAGRIVRADAVLAFEGTYDAGPGRRPADLYGFVDGGGMWVWWDEREAFAAALKSCRERPQLKQDLNRDGVVNSSDQAMVLGSWRQEAARLPLTQRNDVRFGVHLPSVVKAWGWKSGAETCCWTLDANGHPEMHILSVKWTDFMAEYQTVVATLVVWSDLEPEPQPAEPNGDGPA